MGYLDDEATAALGAAESVALAWQPPTSRPMFASLLALDARLGRQVARAREPLIGQIGLAWWRERLAEGSRDDPLLAGLAQSWDARVKELTALVDGWEYLVGGAAIDDAAMEGFASGRGAAIAAMARAIGGDDAGNAAARAGRRWAWATLASRNWNADERARARALGRSLAPTGMLPRSLRGVKVLDGLSARALARGGDLFADRGAALAALRLGMFGR